MGEQRSVVIIGAGLAGLAAAIELQRAGVDLLLLEAADRPGGRIRTEYRDGFLLDRGFQVLNPAYPELIRLGVLEHLNLRPLSAGVGVSLGARVDRLGDPRRVPSWALSSALSRSGSPRQKAALAVYALRCSTASKASLDKRQEMSFGAALSAAGVKGSLYRSVLEPFLQGVFLDDPNNVSRRYGDLVLRSFLRGTPSIPANGMGALPHALASFLEPGTLRLNTTVMEIREKSVGEKKVVTSEGQITADHIIVAVDPLSVSDLIEGFPEPDTKSCTTWYHASDVAPDASRAIRVDGRNRGPLVNSVVLSNVSSEYAPAGRHLISSTALGEFPSTEDEELARAHASLMWGVDTRGWELIGCDVVRAALPKQEVGAALRKNQHIGPGIWVAGDHRDTPSQQGALVSGRRAARAVLGSASSPVR